MIPRTITTAFTLAILGCGFHAAAFEAAPKPGDFAASPAKSVLWVGNSFFYFNNGINRYMTGLGDADKAGRVRSTMVTISGGGIDWHDIDAYLKPGSKVGWYSFVGDNEIKFNPPGRQYDTVVIMDCSQCPIHPQLSPIFHEYAKKNADTARKYGVRPAFFMSWAYKDHPEMTAKLAEAYVTEANANDAFVIPAGLAFAKAIARRPDLELYQPDKRHPTLPGTYLAACTSYAALTGRKVTGNTYYGGLDADLARFLQDVAQQTVDEFYATARAAAAK